MKVFNHLHALICKLESFIVFALLLTMVLLSFWQVVARNVFSKGFHWADDFLRHSVLWTGLLAASLATSESKHIKIDVLSLRLPESVKPKVEAIVSLAAAGICAIVFRYAWEFVRIEREFAEMNYALSVPTWTLEMIFPIAFGLCVFKFTIRGINGLISKPTKA